MRTLLIVAFAGGVFAGDSADGSFGPSNCILVSRSAAGSCMITTNCKDLDTSDVEFGISCVNNGKTQWHSYGKGGFEDNEEFDTGLQCDDCNGPNIDPINGQVTDEHVDAQETEMIHIEPTTPGPVAWMVAPTFGPSELTPDGRDQHSWAPNLWSPTSPADQAPPGVAETQNKITDSEGSDIPKRASQATKPKMTSADNVKLGPHSLLGASSQQKTKDVNRQKVEHVNQQKVEQKTGDGSLQKVQDGYFVAATNQQNEYDVSQKKVEDGYVVADIKNFAETDTSDDASTDSDDAPEYEDEPEAPVQRQQNLRSRHSHIQQKTNVQTFAPAVERFGPRNCISTWRNGQGHCMLQTQCSESDLVNFDVGLICVGADGDETRHLFGKDSFDDNEEFDTQIKCSKCTANRHAKNNQALSEKLQVLSEGIKELTTGMKGIEENVQRLNAKVFPTAALTQTRVKPIHHVQKKTIHRVQNLRAALPQSQKEEGEDDTGEDSGSDASEDTKGMKTEEEQEAEEEELAKQREQEAHEQQVEARRKEEKQRACEQGSEFNQHDDDC